MKELVQFNKEALTEITFYKGIRKANFYQKIETTKSTEEIVELICEITTSSFSVHVCNFFGQYSELKYLKLNIGTDEAIQNVDFFHNWENKQWCETYHFSHETCTLFTASCHLNTNSVVNESIKPTRVSPRGGGLGDSPPTLPDKLVWPLPCPHFVFSWWNLQLLEFVKNMSRNLDKVHIWRNRCGSHLSSQYIFTKWLTNYLELWQSSPF